MTFDVIVLGLGAMGSAASYWLAQRGHRVLGLEQFQSPHNLGSSHGETRVIRQAYYEDPAYVPLLWRAYDLWEQLEQGSHRKLLVQTGGLMIGSKDSEIVSGTLRSVQDYDLPHEFLEGAELERRFPAFKPDRATVAVYEERAGFLWAESAVEACLELAAGHGANLHFHEPVHSWQATPGGLIEVKTNTATYEAGHLIITAGPWAGKLMEDLKLPLQPSRQVAAWLQPSANMDLFRPGTFPIFAWEPAVGLPLYGFPLVHENGGVKVAMHGGGEPCTPDTIDRTIRACDIEQLRNFLAERIPGLSGPVIRTSTCMYTNTPHGHFIIDKHPRHESVTIAAGFSGHGFKFVPVVGEILADLAMSGRTEHPIGLFRLER